MSLQQFEEVLIAKKNKTGPIEYWSYNSIIPSYSVFILGFQKNLAVGSVEWNYKDTKFHVFLIKEFVEPTFVEFLRKNPDRTSLSAKTDDIEILSY